MPNHENPNPNPAMDHGFGVLNSVTKPAIRKRFDSATSNPMQAMARAAAESYAIDTLQHRGQFKGIVLRVSEPSTLVDPTSSLALFYSDYGIEPPALVKIKVRVPEVHSMLPIPNQLGSAPGSHQAIINMYPTFIAQSTAVQIPKPGDLVWVDWGNRINWTDPYYIRPVLEQGVGLAGGLGADGAGDTHRNCSGNSYSPQSPAGNPIAGSNTGTEPFTGLPRLKRQPGSTGQAVFVTGDVVDPTSKTNWEKAATALPPGFSKMWASQNNGRRDEKHSHGFRMSLLWHANTVDFVQPWELIYWFHGLNGFSKKNFEGRMVPQLKKMVEEGRNFVFVKPELPWSERGTGPARGDRQKNAWNPEVDWGGDFAAFHSEILAELQLLGVFAGPSFISIYGHSNGGSAIAKAAAVGALSEVGPNRVFFSDSDYGWGFGNGGAVGTAWEKYVKDHPGVWLTALTINDHTPRKLAIKFFSDNKDAIAGRSVYHIQSNKTHKWCGDNALSIVSEEHRKKTLAATTSNAAAAANAAPGDDAAEERASALAEFASTQNNTASIEDPNASLSWADAIAADREKKEGGFFSSLFGEDPPGQGPPAVPSEVSKQSTTAKSPSYKTETPTPYKENRIKVDDYGGPLVGSAASSLLEKVEPRVKLHKLAAARYKVFKAAAIAAGFPNFKISSGWREHKWASRAAYDAKMIADYGSVREGRKWKAFNSPHELGLAMDVKAHGVYASTGGSRTKNAQESTDLFKWMKANAYRFGLTPYKREPWHWELRLPYAAFASGEEFTEDFSTRVTNVGKKGAQLPTVSGAGAPGGGAPCVSTNGGGGYNGDVGAYTPGPTFTVSDSGGLGDKLVGGATAVSPSSRPFNKKVTLFVCHEAAMTPWGEKKLQSFLKNRAKKPEKGVHYWGSCEGKIIQTAPPETKMWHANTTNSFSVGIEVMTHSSTPAGDWKDRISKGMHQVTHKGKGDISCEPGKVTASSMRTGAAQLATPQQMESMWQLIVHLSTYSAPTQGGAQIAIPIAFPCVPDKDKFWWTKWAGYPTNDYVPCSKWFGKHKPAGIVSHHRIGSHVDGIAQEYYALGRAQGLGPKEAYWAHVGALCSGNKENGMVWTKHPKHYVALGKKKFPESWFAQKTRHWVGSDAWGPLKTANPHWFAANLEALPIIDPLGLGFA